MMITEITACWRGKVTICVFRCRVFQCVRKYKAVLILQVFFSRRLKKSFNKTTTRGIFKCLCPQRQRDTVTSTSCRILKHVFRVMWIWSGKKKSLLCNSCCCCWLSQVQGSWMRVPFSDQIWSWRLPESIFDQVIPTVIRTPLCAACCLKRN